MGLKSKGVVDIVEMGLGLGLGLAALRGSGALEGLGLATEGCCRGCIVYSAV